MDRASPCPPERTSPTIRYAGIGDEAGAAVGEQADALRRLGWSAIELRTVDGQPLADLGDPAFDQLAYTRAETDLAVVCVASRIGSWARPITGDFDLDLRELDMLASRCRALGTRYIRVMSYVNEGLDEREWGRRAVGRLRELAERAERAGVVLLHENCTGWAGTNAERMLEMLDEVGSPALGLLFDTGNGIAYGYDTYELLKKIRAHVAHVHVKDALGSPDKPRYTLPGAGSARVADCLRLLLADGYSGTWSIEPHLSLRPHESAELREEREEADGGQRRAGFLASGRALERLVRETLLPAFPAWTAVPSGLDLAGDARPAQRASSEG